MPSRPPRPCAQPGCPALVVGASRCAAHSTRPERGSSTKQGYSSKWRKARAEYLAQHPRCECKAHKGKPDAPPSTCIDHIVAHKGDHELFWNRRNWCAMSKPCHDAKKESEERGATTAKPVREEPAEAAVAPASGFWFV